MGVMSKPTQLNEDDLLRELLAGAEQLCCTEDALMQGQYKHLRDRIRALIELRLCATLETKSK